MALPNSIQHAADYADALEQKLQSEAQVTDAPELGNDEPVHQDDQPADDTEKLRSRYASLQGKYNAEVPRLHSRAKELEAQLQQLMEENASLRGEIAKQEEAKSYLTERDSETYGEDMVDLVRRAAKEESSRFAREAATLKSQVEELRQQMSYQAQTVAAQREEAFYEALSAAVPDWETQNTEQGFLDWLAQADPLYGFQRNEALQRAFNARDAQRVAAIFLEYQQTAQRSSNPLARQVNPKGSRASVDHQGQPMRTFTNKDVADFYDAWRRGKYTDEQAALIEKEIQDAVAAGRVVPA